MELDKAKLQEVVKRLPTNKQQKTKLTTYLIRWVF